MTKAMAAEGIRVRYLDRCGLNEAEKHSQNTATEEELRRVADATAETLIHLAEALDGELQTMHEDKIDLSAFILGAGFGAVLVFLIITVAMLI